MKDSDLRRGALSICATSMWLSARSGSAGGRRSYRTGGQRAGIVRNSTGRQRKNRRFLELNNLIN
jgi:hypothetical protein